MHQQGTRAVPSLRYLRDAPRFAENHHFLDGDIGPVGGFTWDGRAASLGAQARIPLLASNEMANTGPADIVRKLRRTPYAALFRAAFGEHIFEEPERAFEAGLLALETFQHEPAEFFPYTSRYDAYLRGEVELTEQEERGAALFKDPQKANCASCHLGTARDGIPPPFTDFDYVNVGVPRNPRLRANRDPRYFDLGLCGPARKDLADRREYCGYFRSPTMRNVALRDAFFHNGVFTSLRDVIRFYNERDLHPEKYYSRNADGGVHPFDDLPAGYPQNIDHDPPLDRKPGDSPALTEPEIDDLIAFLNTLTDGYSVPRPAMLDWSAPAAVFHNQTAARTNSDEYAWRLFVSLSWPADQRTRAPDRSAPLGADRPVVWESWLNIGQVYLERGADPGPWTARRADLPPELRFETFSRGELQNLRQVVKGAMVPVKDPIASARRLTEIHMNRAAFEYVRARKLFSIEGQIRAASADQDISFPYGACEVKAKWRPISASERYRYHTMEVTLAGGTRRLYGLTGLHIAAKELPDWFWATFEHVDNPTLPDNEGWQLPSRDRFSCGEQHPDCNRSPAGIGLEGTVWANYRLRGTLTGYTDAAGKPQLLANSELENGMQRSASCMTCHARASIAVAGGEPIRLPIFNSGGDGITASRGIQAPDSLTRTGFVGLPDPAWYSPPSGANEPRFRRLDFVWSLMNAKSGSTSSAE